MKNHFENVDGSTVAPEELSSKALEDLRRPKPTFVVAPEELSIKALEDLRRPKPTFVLTQQKFRDPSGT